MITIRHVSYEEYLRMKAQGLTGSLRKSKKMKAMYKSEIARAAGISSRTLSRWIRTHRMKLMQMGVKRRQKLLPPCAVNFICKELGIDEDELDFP